MSKRDRFYELAPKIAFFLDTSRDDLESYLWGRRWLQSGESVISAEIAGEGNMNYIVRVTTNTRTVILKQSRPWVEKYPDIAAPFDRALVEAQFYSFVRGTSTAEFMPRVFWVDEESRILCFEDLGALSDFTNVYSGSPIRTAELKQLLRFLSLLHSSRVRLTNHEMRALNYHHIFVFPFQSDNNLDLNRITPGLQRVADSVRGNHVLGSRIAELGRVYLSDGSFLVHGDYFPGSWLRSASGVRVIDPEFGFSGVREFDLGVMLAHFLICGDTDAPAAVASSYAHWSDLDQRLVQGFAGVEVLRRLLGVAQLPIRFDLKRKQNLVNKAIEMVLA